MSPPQVKNRPAAPQETSLADPAPSAAARGKFAARFISKDPRVLEVLDLVCQVADTDATVLITGETGTGKELIARELHSRSSRRHSPFLALNCGAVTESLQDSELFGHAKGAFTGAAEERPGKFEAAEGGTLFLDEVAEMSRSLQVKLLRVLQYGEYSPVGTAANRYCDVRVVAATNRDLLRLTALGQFRNDLYYRLNIIRLHLPPLRERRGDIPLLIDHFLRAFRAAYHKEGLELSAEAADVLRHYDYPGNVRELENVLLRTVLVCRAGAISPRDLALEVRAGLPTPAVPAPANFHEAKARVVEEFEQAYLAAVLAACGGIVSRAARCAGLSERNFHEKLKKYHLHGEHFRARPAAPPASPDTDEPIRLP
jgi:DNA-binding NtrC family response regulator